MSEADLWQELDKLMGKKWHASRVESHSTSAGIPDVDYCYCGDGHVELKFSDTNLVPDIRASQVRWMMRRSQKEGRVFMLTKMKNPDDGKWVYLWHLGCRVAYLHRNRNFEDWFNMRINDRYWELSKSETILILSGERSS